MPSPLGTGPAHEKKIGHRRVDASGETTYKKARLFPSRPADCLITAVDASLLVSLPPDGLLCPAGCHPAGHRLHRRQPELQTREGRADAGLLHGGEHFLPQVRLHQW